MNKASTALLTAAVFSGCFVEPSELPSADGGDTRSDAGGVVGGGADACSDDAFEPNDSPDAGSATTPRTHIVGQPPIQLSGTACADNVDLYRGFADCCPGFGVTVTWDAGLGTLDVALLAADLSDMRADGGLDLVDIRPGYIKLLQMDEGGYFFARIMSPNANIPYSLTLQAPVYGP